MLYNKARKREYDMKQYKTLYYEHKGKFTNKDQSTLDYIMNEMAKMGFHLVSTLNHGPCYSESYWEVILLFFERDIPDEE